MSTKQKQRWNPFRQQLAKWNLTDLHNQQQHLISACVAKLSMPFWGRAKSKCISNTCVIIFRSVCILYIVYCCAKLSVSSFQSNFGGLGGKRILVIWDEAKISPSSLFIHLSSFKLCNLCTFKLYWLYVMATVPQSVSKIQLFSCRQFDSVKKSSWNQ